MKKTILLLCIIVGVIISYLLISLEGLWNDTIPENTQVERVGVIYGNKVELSGEPSARLKARLDAGYDLYQHEKIEKIMVSGGLGFEGFDEAQVMQEYLVRKGIPKEDILLDSNGYTTHKTSKNSFMILGKDTVVVGISQWFHVARVKLSLQQEGFDTVYGYAPKYLELRDIYSLLRELPAYIKYVFKH